MNKINKFIVIALAAFLLQSCSTELQNLARSSSDVYQKQEYRKWDQLVETRKVEIKAKREAMVVYLRNQRGLYRTLRAYHILIEDYSLFTLDEDFIDRSKNKSCRRPDDARMGRQYLLEFVDDNGQDKITLTSNKRRESHKQEEVKVLSNQELYQVLEKDVQNFIDCTEGASPGIFFDEDKQWFSPESLWNAKAFLLKNAIINRVYFAIPQ